MDIKTDNIFNGKSWTKTFKYECRAGNERFFYFNTGYKKSSD